ncbi:TPR-like protein [Penicillium sp. IBT 18751x]|nr:TPR-like protein [Penicillium sp. IBT 18751x]
MSGPCVLDSITLIISILTASVNLFDGSLKDFELSESFNAPYVGTQIKCIWTFDQMETIEALMRSIVENVQSIVSAHKVLAADSKQNTELDEIIAEMRSLMAFSFQKPFGSCLGRAPYLPTGFFVGRADELAALANALNPSLLTSELQRVILGGVRGVGKTQLAIAYGESRSGSYESCFGSMQHPRAYYGKALDH